MKKFDAIKWNAINIPGAKHWTGLNIQWLSVNDKKWMAKSLCVKVPDKTFVSMSGIKDVIDKCSTFGGGQSLKCLHNGLTVLMAKKDMVVFDKNHSFFEVMPNKTFDPFTTFLVSQEKYRLDKTCGYIDLPYDYADELVQEILNRSAFMKNGWNSYVLKRDIYELAMVKKIDKSR